MVAGLGRRRDAIAMAGALVVVAGLIWVVRAIRTSDNPTTTATEYGAYLGAVALAVTLLALLVQWWWKGLQPTAVSVTAEQTTVAADQLAQRMLGDWRREATDQRISTPAPVRVEWRWGPHEMAPPPAQLTTALVAGTGPLPTAEPNADRPGVLLEAGVLTAVHRAPRYGCPRPPNRPAPDTTGSLSPGPGPLHGDRAKTLSALTQARSIAPQLTRYHSHVHETVYQLAETDHRTTASLAGFARWLGLTL